MQTILEFLKCAWLPVLAGILAVIVFWDRIQLWLFRRRECRRLDSAADREKDKIDAEAGKESAALEAWKKKMEGKK